MKKEKRTVADVSAVDCIAALKAQFPSPEFAFFEQVANGTGWSGRRWADAVAMGIWPSRGLLMHGFEIKVDRADWKRELKNPKKVEESLYQFWVVGHFDFFEPHGAAFGSGAKATSSSSDHT